jgi:hypothetical protein
MTRYADRFQNDDHGSRILQLTTIPAWARRVTKLSRQPMPHLAIRLSEIGNEFTALQWDVFRQLVTHDRFISRAMHDSSR